MKSNSFIAKPESLALMRRFAGIANLYGAEGLAKLNNAHVCIIGVGGVGSWVVESLARSAVGEMTLIDMDVVSESNINRQLLAVTETIGKDKVAVLKERVHQINPDCKVTTHDEFISRDNLDLLLKSNMDFIIDCIDDFRLKAALIHYCKQKKYNVLTIGAAGGQTNPSKIRQTDLSVTQHDALLARTRKLLRQDYHFPRNPKRSFSIPCVYSDEQPVYPDGAGGLSQQRPINNDDEQTMSALSCAGGLGSITHVTGTFAFYASAYVLNRLVK